MKLSKAQERALQQIKAKIDKAREHDTFTSWLFDTNSFLKCRTNRVEIYQNDRKFYDCYVKYYENYKKGMALSTAGKNVLWSLERKGLIKIVELDENRASGVLDWVQLINY